MLSYSVGYATERGHVTVSGNMASDLYRSVGVTGFEPATSSSRTPPPRVQAPCTETYAQATVLCAATLTASDRT
jgi:hypothetical protein